MTSTVIIEAHCSDDKVVEVLVEDMSSGETFEHVYLENGERKQIYIYDYRSVSTGEIEKKYIGPRTCKGCQFISNSTEEELCSECVNGQEGKIKNLFKAQDK